RRAVCRPRPTATRTAGPTTATCARPLPTPSSPTRISTAAGTAAGLRPSGRKRGIFVIAARGRGADPPAMKLIRPPVRRVVLVASPDAQVLDVTGPLEVLSNSNRRLDMLQDRRSPRYTIEIAAREAGPVRTNSGIQLVADRALRDVRGPI